MKRDPHTKHGYADAEMVGCLLSPLSLPLGY